MSMNVFPLLFTLCTGFSSRYQSPHLSISHLQGLSLVIDKRDLKVNIKAEEGRRKCCMDGMAKRGSKGAREATTGFWRHCFHSYIAVRLSCTSSLLHESTLLLLSKVFQQNIHYIHKRKLYLKYPDKKTRKTNFNFYHSFHSKNIQRINLFKEEKRKKNMDCTENKTIETTKSSLKKEIIITVILAMLPIKF